MAGPGEVCAGVRAAQVSKGSQVCSAAPVHVLYDLLFIKSEKSNVVHVGRNAELWTRRVQHFQNMIKCVA